jgi:hypothetical protein
LCGQDDGGVETPLSTIAKLQKLMSLVQKHNGAAEESFNSIGSSEETPQIPMESIDVFEQLLPKLQGIANPVEISHLQQMIAGLKQALLQVDNFEKKVASRSENRAYNGLGSGSNPADGVTAGIMKVCKMMVAQVIRMIQRMVQSIMNKFQQMVRGMRPRGLDLADLPLEYPMMVPKPPPMPDLGPRDKPYPWYFVPPRWYNTIPKWYAEPKNLALIEIGATVNEDEQTSQINCASSRELLELLGVAQNHQSRILKLEKASLEAMNMILELISA